MNHVELFEFIDEGWTPSGDEYAAEVPVGVRSAEALLQALYDALHLPGYFGFNWNALSDCLRDFHWLQQRAIVLRHRDVPALPAAELRTYLEVLAEAVGSWQPGEEHSLRVVFPSKVRAEVLRLMAHRT
jgi:hypothetical protein